MNLKWKPRKLPLNTELGLYRREKKVTTNKSVAVVPFPLCWRVQISTYTNRLCTQHCVCLFFFSGNYQSTIQTICWSIKSENIFFTVQMQLINSRHKCNMACNFKRCNVRYSMGLLYCNCSSFANANVRHRLFIRRFIDDRIKCTIWTRCTRAICTWILTSKSH